MSTEGDNDTDTEIFQNMRLYMSHTTVRVCPVVAHTLDSPVRNDKVTALRINFVVHTDIMIPRGAVDE